MRKRGVELRASDWETWSDWGKVEKGSERRGETEGSANTDRRIDCDVKHKKRATRRRPGGSYDCVTLNDGRCVVLILVRSHRQNFELDIEQHVAHVWEASLREWRRSDWETSSGSKDRDAKREKAGRGLGSCRSRNYCQRPDAMATMTGAKTRHDEKAEMNDGGHCECFTHLTT